MSPGTPSKTTEPNVSGSHNPAGSALSSNSKQSASPTNATKEVPKVKGAPASVATVTPYPLSGSDALQPVPWNPWFVAVFSLLVGFLLTRAWDRWVIHRDETMVLKALNEELWVNWSVIKNLSKIFDESSMSKQLTFGNFLEVPRLSVIVVNSIRIRPLHCLKKNVALRTKIQALAVTSEILNKRLDARSSFFNSKYGTDELVECMQILEFGMLKQANASMPLIKKIHDELPLSKAWKGEMTDELPDQIASKIKLIGERIGKS